MFCIVLADRPHGNILFFPGLSLGKSKNAALVFSCGWQIRILCISMPPSLHPSTSSLQPLNPATSHNNNNYVGLQACVRAAGDIEYVIECSSSTSLSVLTNDPGFLHEPFSSSCCSVSPSTVCLYTVRKLYEHAPSLLLCFW